MTKSPGAIPRRALAFGACYLVAYFVASYMDLATTALGLERPGTFEKNVFATDATGYLPARAWLLTAGGAIVMAGCIWFAARYRAEVDPRWLRQPGRSFGKLYLNPWSKAALAASPIHALSLAIAFVLLRGVAAANNLLVYWFGFGPMGELIKAIGAETSPLAGFAIVACSFYVVACILVSPMAARLIAFWRSTP
ncbi:MAG: hypothetical protein FIB04_08770 [Gammaproteobacteria bacterium]|nr:hypothetical protein [Gammaproteobacteria bacterium]